MTIENKEHSFEGAPIEEASKTKAFLGSVADEVIDDVSYCMSTIGTEAAFEEALLDMKIKKYFK